MGKLADESSHSRKVAPHKILISYKEIPGRYHLNQVIKGNTTNHGSNQQWAPPDMMQNEDTALLL